jgi:hypothetical protein
VVVTGGPNGGGKTIVGSWKGGGVVVVVVVGVGVGVGVGVSVTLGSGCCTRVRGTQV